MKPALLPNPTYFAVLPQHTLIGVVRAYRFWLKPWLGNACRFEPSCSAYAQQALQQHGAARGAALAGWRLLRCQPWCEGGCDAVPDSFRWPKPWAKAGLFTRLMRRPSQIPDSTHHD